MYKNFGLTSEEANKKLQEYGYNEIKREKKVRSFFIFLNQLKSPLVYILLLATIIAYYIGDKIEAIIILIIIVINTFLSFFQEYKAEKTFKLLKKYIVLRAKIIRDNQVIEVNAKKLVPDDVIFFEAGDIIPADIKILEEKNLSVNEAILTGESEPIEKHIDDMIFMGTSVLTGNAIGIIIATGNKTKFGRIAKIIDQEPITDFQKNIKKFSFLLLIITIILIGFVFIVNVILKKNFFESILFALALAVGITPELLPIIITITLSIGAIYMSQKKVIVKKLSSIENLGNMDTLCCDKTGTLTEGIFHLEKYFNLEGIEDNLLLIYSLLCSSINLNQINSKNNVGKVTNLVDKAIFEKVKEKNLIEECKKNKILDKTEFDFITRLSSCIIQNENGKKFFVVKGSPDAILSIPKKDNNIDLINTKVHELESKGYRVLLIAYKEIIKNEILKDLNLNQEFIIFGYLIFIDPPKRTAKNSIDEIHKLGINIKIISGDSPIITKKICNDLGLRIVEDKIITGDDIQKLKENDLYEYFKKYNIYARINPEQKFKIIKTLNKNGHIIGFLGDGINDTPAIKAADIGISVNSAVEIAKDAADIVLLKKSLLVLIDGIIEGRKAFGNTRKYILNTISANFGNMITVAVSSIFLPFIPLLPSQILLTNLISDIPLVTIATDNIDKDLLLKPKKWNKSLIIKFMIYFGLISTFYDLILIIPMRFFKIPVNQFRTCWFTFSCLTEILITFFIRTKQTFYKSRPGNKLIIASIIMVIITLILPLIKFNFELFKLTKISLNLYVLIFINLFLYLTTVEILKKFFYKKLE